MADVNSISATITPYGAGAEVVRLDAIRARRQFAELTQHLSERELAVLGQLARGLLTEEVASEMFLSPHTIRSHVKAAMRKLGARTRAHAVAIALTAGAIDAV